MKVFKFGGASIRDSEHLKNVGEILSSYQNEKIVIVVSAMGKTTNALEKVVAAYIDKTGQATKLIQDIRESLFQEVKKLFTDSSNVFQQLNDLFVEIDWILEEEPQDGYDYIYDQIVSIGELASSMLLHGYLEQQFGQTAYMDIRDVLITDDTYREANVNWKITSDRISKKVEQLSKNANWIVTQGFIGSTDDNQTTTLGREGSDFTAAILSYACDVESMTIWKDVPGILTADPSKFTEVEKIDRLTYKEAIEMTYYGAKVIHTKTIKPIQNKSIPMYVKSYIDPQGSGTLISKEMEIAYPPIVVLEENQSLLHFSTLDFSFVAERHLSRLFSLFDQYRIKVNMMRNSAISFTICTHNVSERINPLMEDLKSNFNIVRDDGLELITVRHYNQSTVDGLKKDRVLIFEERLGNTLQMVVKQVKVIQRKA